MMPDMKRCRKVVALLEVDRQILGGSDKDRAILFRERK
jgi:hypothetical protein